MSILDLLPRAIANRWARGHLKHTYLFLLSPPFSGSTVIKELLETSPAVSAFPTEGQWLPGLKNVLGTADRWERSKSIDWSRVRSIFDRYWDYRKPVLFEKSPPLLLRAEELAKVFSPAKFLITMRNPYAQAERRVRNGASPRFAVEQWLLCARHQRQNLEALPHYRFFTYEQLTEKTSSVLEEIVYYVPELHGLNAEATFHARNITGKPIVGLRNLNDEKIARLSVQQIDEITAALKPDVELVRYFGYDLLA